MHPVRWLVTALLVVSLAGPVGCGDEDTGSDVTDTIDVEDAASDTAPAPDTADDDTVDADTEVDADADDTADADTQPQGDTAPPPTGLLITNSTGDETWPVTQAFFGMTVGSAGDTPLAVLYLEISEDGDGSCPEEGSATPAYTLIVSGPPLPATATPISTAGGLTVTLLDFSGVLLPDNTVFQPAASATVTVDDADVCLDCFGDPAPSQPNGNVTITLDATFGSGSSALTVSGTVSASHCDSLDAQD